MNKTIKLFLTMAVICSGMVMGLTIFAQENQVDQTPNLISTQDATQEIAQDETVNPEDLDSKEQKVLPDSPFYFLKEWKRTIQSVLTFDPVKKAELKQKFANEKILEVEKMIKEGKTSEVINKAIEKYKNATEEIKNQVDKIKENAEQNQETNKFLDKFINQQILHEKILQKLQTQVPPEVLQKIEEAREKHLEKFSEVMTKLETRTDKIKERIENAINSQEGSEFKDFKNLEVLEAIKEKLPEEAKDALTKVQENTLNRLKEAVENLPGDKQAKFKEYVEKISGDKEKQLEILENLKSEVKEENTTIKEKIQEIREKIIEKIPEQINAKKIDCPKIVKPAPGFCEKGRAVPKRNEQGCVISFDCITPAETTNEKSACITLWDPVCGKNGKTYSNDCCSKIAGVEIAYKGICKEKECKTDADCPLLKCPTTTNSAVKCLEMKNKCVNGKCVEVSFKVEAE